jgi:two-component system sensor histidine kinase HydH
VRPPDPEWLRAVAAANGLLRVDLLDRDGRPYAWPGPPPGGRMMMGRMGTGMPGMMGPHPPGSGPPPESHRAMMRYLWGRRWLPEPTDPGVPPPIRDRRYWEGSVFGVAVGARSFPGIIAVHADAAYVLHFTKEIGVQRQVEDLGRQAGVEAVALLGPDLTVMAHSDPGRVGQKVTDESLARLLRGGEPASRFTASGGPGQVLEVMRPLALDGGRPGLLQIRLATASMEEVWRRDRLAAVVIGLAVLGVGALGLAAIFYTQQRHLARVTALEGEVARRQRLATLGNMAAGVSHEIRNPLNAVSMGLQRLRAEFRPTAEAEEYDRVLALVGAEVRRLNGLVEDFLALARPPVLKPEPIRIGDLVAETMALIEPEARRIGVRLEPRLPGDLPPITADPDRLKQVLLNLARNALDAMPEGGTLWLDAAATGRTVTLAVTDSGPGLSPEARARLFEPYFTTKARGLGLGLALARQIVEAHGGTIDAEPAEGGGTRFRVTLPREPGRA